MRRVAFRKRLYLLLYGGRTALGSAGTWNIVAARPALSMAGNLNEKRCILGVHLPVFFRRYAIFFLK